MNNLLIALGKAPEKREIDGKLLGLPPNRALYDEDGSLSDIVVGTFFLCGAPPDSENFASLSDEQIARYAEHFASPEQFLLLSGHIVAVEERAVK